MQVAVLSDLHLGGKDALDRFARARAAEARLLGLLARLERHVDRVVLLGDIFETLRGLKPGTAARELRTAMAAYPGVARRVLEDPRYQLVHGNHDAVAAEVLGSPEHLRLEDHGTRMVFFHGHQLDRLARGRAPLSRLGVWAGGLLERLGVPVTHRLDRAGRRGRAPGAGDPPAADGASSPAADAPRAALVLGRALGGDVVVNGHTHAALRVERGGQLYLNSGTCLGGQHEIVLLDTGAHRYEVLVETGDADP
jgi:predicted phosphodiesterase